MKLPVMFGKGIIVGVVRLALLADLDHARWCEIGADLRRLDRAVAWWVGDWWPLVSNATAHVGRSPRTLVGRDRRIRPAPMPPLFVGRLKLPAGGKL